MSKLDAWGIVETDYGDIVITCEGIPLNMLEIVNTAAQLRGNVDATFNIIKFDLPLPATSNDDNPHCWEICQLGYWYRTEGYGVEYSEAAEPDSTD